MASSGLGLPKKLGRTRSPGNYKEGVWEKKGRTRVGRQPWECTTVHCKDSEDENTCWTVKIGDLSFHHTQDYGRDYATDEVSITHPEAGTVSSSDASGRDGHSSHETQGDVGPLREVIANVSAREGMTPQQFADNLPAPFGQFISQRGLI
mmetsp:Transcript_24262/g.67967  ORF Transcript_24262/g.67967 Transcript_24262/m.67967 type:complete len:150 (+) Transcript_24262:84-533(+)